MYMIPCLYKMAIARYTSPKTTSITYLYPMVLEIPLGFSTELQKPCLLSFPPEGVVLVDILAFQTPGRIQKEEPSECSMIYTLDVLK